jgi:hypothetical protein
MSTGATMALPELEAGLHEYEGAAPVWRGAYGLGEAETEAFFENLAEYAVGGGGGGRGGLGRAASLAHSAALAGGVPLAQIGFEGEAGTYVDPKSGLVRLSPLMVVEHFGHAMAEAESESEAEAFLPLLLPLAARALPMIARAVAPRLGQVISRVAPQLMRGAGRVLRTLRRSPSTRPLVRVLPTVMRRTLAGIAGDIQRGRQVTPQRAVSHLAAQSRRVIANPQTCASAYRRSRAMDRRYHLICHRVVCG